MGRHPDVAFLGGGHYSLLAELIGSDASGERRPLRRRETQRRAGRVFRVPDHPQSMRDKISDLDTC
jgi:hypothetical protein